MAGRIEGRVALVTGGASGLGRAQAIRFAREGAAVVVADLDGDGARQVAHDLAAEGLSAVGVEVDVTDDSSVRTLVSTALDRYDRIDILSNTAGTFDMFVQLLDMPRTTWQRVFDVNVTSLYTMCSAVLPHMVEQKRGVVLNIASGAGLKGGGGGAAYTPAKHAVVGFTRQLAAAYGLHGIRVNCIAPGLIDTPMTKDFSHTPETAAVLARYPAGRIGQPEDIANAALFLVSDEADFIHAATLIVDGGQVETFGAHLEA